MTHPVPPDPVCAEEREALARLCFSRAQSFYRRDYDHTPMTHTWETTTEDVREGWRTFARELMAAGYARPVPPAAAPVGELRKVLQLISEQLLTSEMTEDERDAADIEGGYDLIILDARAALVAAPVTGDRETAGVEPAFWTQRRRSSGDFTYSLAAGPKAPTGWPWDLPEFELVPLYSTPPSGGGDHAGGEALTPAQLIERDRAKLAGGLEALDRVLKSREWLAEGRGPYEWDDDRYRDEFTATAGEIRVAVQGLREIARDWTGCPTTSAEIKAARATAATASGVEDALNEFADAINARCANPRSDNDKWRKAKRRVAAAREAVLLAASPKAQGSDVGLRLELAEAFVDAVRSCITFRHPGNAIALALKAYETALAASRTGQKGAGE